MFREVAEACEQTLNIWPLVVSRTGRPPTAHHDHGVEGDR